MASTPPPLDLSPVRFATTLAELTSPVVIESEDGSITVLEVLGAGKVRLSRADKADPEYLNGRPMATEVGDLAVLECPSRPVRAFALPAGAMQVRHRLTVMLATSLFALAMLAVIALVLLSGLSDAMKVFCTVALMTIAAVAPLLRARLRPSAKHSFRTAGGDYPLDRLLDARPAVAAAAALVDSIKEEYGALLSDLCYRIENPALFDPADDAARRFTTALIRWDTRAAELEASEVSTLAAEVRVAFDAARSHAETLGMDHLPAASRPEAERALKTARLAERAATPSERSAALKRVSEILASLALYYLPTPTEATQMVEGRPVLALPGRLTTGEADQ